MLLAEFNGKLSPAQENKEDFLTSDIFSFFKYSRRDIFLKNYLIDLGIKVNDDEAKNAEFLLWPRYSDNTEPDVVIIVGKYYLLFEAKYKSGFGVKTAKTKAQLVREIENGIIDAKVSNKEFILITITADHYYIPEKFVDIPVQFRAQSKWTNWQHVVFFIEQALPTNPHLLKSEREFALDICSLLDHKKLRGFRGFSLSDSFRKVSLHKSIFFEAAKAEFRGDFIGFMQSFENMKIVANVPRRIFYSNREEIFASLSEIDTISQIDSKIFYERS